MSYKYIGKDTDQHKYGDTVSGDGVDLNSGDFIMSQEDNSHKVRNGNFYQKSYDPDYQSIWDQEYLPEDPNGDYEFL